MKLTTFDHVNVKTSRLDDMIEWYDRVLGLKSGPRPEFGFPGAWLYLGENAIVHLVGVDSEPAAQDPKIEHFAIRATGLADFLAHLNDNGIEPRLGTLPGMDITQVNLHDPDGNHIHVDFAELV